MTQENNNKLRKIIFNEFSLVAAVFAAAFSIFLYVSGPARDMDLMEQRVGSIEINDIPHLEEAIEKLIIKDEKQNEMIQEINIKLERILTLLTLDKQRK